MVNPSPNPTPGARRPRGRSLRGPALLCSLLLAACGPSGGPGGPRPPGPSGPPQSGVVGLETVVTGLAFPAGVAHAGDDRLFVLELGGTVRVVRDGALLPTPFLDLTDRVGEGGEGGLLGLAFPPDHASSGVFYVYYTDRDQPAGSSVLSRFRVTADPDVADPASEEVLVTEPQPATNHNGGQLAFGPDGYLYWAMGDGGDGGEPAQALDSRLGKLLRLDVGAASGYAAPASNPFAGQGSPADEVWAYGLRNPWRFSFDRATGDLYIADVGEDRFEEVNVEPAGSGGGRNYGWPLMEAEACHLDADCDAAAQGLTLPTFSYPWGQDWGRSITGGYVYRGSAVPELEGSYVFGDFVTGRVWASSAALGWELETLLDTGFNITSFGEDAAGELYLVDALAGTLYRLVAE
ncbi:MAG: PQQ-dependent sugar dehydrogenase [Deinococcales bacterium]|nr:PQQ-dependent sugar dehydrogenase [Deinococcales bacterium]